MQPKIQKRIQKQQQTTPPQVEIKEYPMQQPVVAEFDQIMIGYMKDLNDQNNMYQGLRQQEEQLRMNLNTLHKAIHELRTMRDEQLRNIYMPYLNGLRQITPASRDEFIKANIKMYDNFDNQYKSVVAQRQHRADELGEIRMRVLKYLWSLMISQHKMTQEELWDILKTDEENIKGIRLKKELPQLVV